MYAKDEPVTKAVEEEKLNKYHWRLLIILMFVWLFSSMNQMFYSLTVPLIMEEWQLTYVVIGVIWSAMLLPSVFGSMIFRTLADYFGRKKCLIAAVLGFFTPRVLVGLTQDWVQLAAVMAMASFGHGGIFPTVFSMVSEELPARKRGFGVSVAASGYALGGGVLAGLVVAVLAPVSWRAVYFVGSIPAILIVFALRFLPESRVWLAAEVEEKKRASLSWLQRIRNFKPLTLWERRYLKRILLVFLVRFLGTVLWAGVASWVVTFLLFERYFSAVSGAIWFAFFGFFGFFGNWLNGWCADRIGRKWTISLFYIGSGISILVFTMFAHTQTQAFLMTIPIGLALLGLYPTTFTFASEMLPPEARATGMASIMILMKPFTIVLPIIIGILATAHSLAFCFTTFATYVVVVGLVLLFLLPETRGKIF